MQYSAVLFDMDGVVIDTEKSVTAFWRRIADWHGIALSKEDFRRHVYGRPAGSTLDALFPRLSPDDRRSVFAAMQEHENQDVYRPLPGVLPFLRTLHDHGIPTALVTSGEPWKVRVVFQQLPIADLFATCITAADISKGKPDPQCYLLAAQQLGAPPEACLVFEDAVSGVEAAVAAGATCVGIAPPRREDPLLAAGANPVVPNFIALVYRDGALDLGNGTMMPLAPRRPNIQFG